MSLVPAWLVSYESTLPDVPACQMCGNRSYGSGDINSYINFYENTME